jgi:hypothetical protein
MLFYVDFHLEVLKELIQRITSLWSRGVIMITESYNSLCARGGGMILAPRCEDTQACIPFILYELYVSSA